MVDVAATRYTVIGVPLVLAMAAGATLTGRASRRLRPVWLAIGISAFVSGGWGLAFVAVVRRFALPSEAALPSDATPVLQAILAVFCAIVGAVEAGRPASAHRAGPTHQAEEGQPPAAA